MTRAFLLLALAALAGACIDDHYECQVDADCNTGAGGRCELDHHCTIYDQNCTLSRRYTAHSGAKSGACFDESSVPLDYCAGGQPPAVATDPCAAAVCSRLPSCCATGWGDECVQLAQVSCPSLVCDTRLAITAESSLVAGAGNPPQLYDLRFTGLNASYVRVDNAGGASGRRSFLDWLAPAHGETEPRLAGIDATTASLMIADGDNIAKLPVGDRQYDGLYAVDFDRDGRDKAVLASYQVSDGQIDVLDLDTGNEREMSLTSAAPLATWGDWDGDGYPDIVAASNGAQTYQLLHNVDDPDTNHARSLEQAFTSGTTPPSAGNAPIQAFAWSDLDGDGNIDFVQFGAQVRIHFGQDDHSPNTPRTQIDCRPLQINPPATCPVADDEVIGTAVFGPSSTRLVVSIDDGTRNLYEVDFAGKTATVVAKPLWLDPACGPPATANCPPIRLVVARDLDGDHQLELIAVDADLTVYVLDANGTLKKTLPPPTIPTAFKIVRASVSGAPR